MATSIRPGPLPPGSQPFQRSPPGTLEAPPSVAVEPLLRSRSSQGANASRPSPLRARPRSASLPARSGMTTLPPAQRLHPPARVGPPGRPAHPSSPAEGNRWAFAAHLAARTFLGRRPPAPLFRLLLAMQHTLEEAESLLVHGRGNVVPDIDASGGESMARAQAAQRFAYWFALGLMEAQQDRGWREVFKARTRIHVSEAPPSIDHSLLARDWAPDCLGALDRAGVPREASVGLISCVAHAVATAWAGAGNCSDLAHLNLVLHGRRAQDDEDTYLPYFSAHGWMSQVSAPTGDGTSFRVTNDLWAGSPGHRHAVEHVDHSFDRRAIGHVVHVRTGILRFMRDIFDDTLARLDARQGAGADLFDALLQAQRDPQGHIRPDSETWQPSELLSREFRRGARASARADPLAGIKAVAAAARAGLPVRWSNADEVEARILSLIDGWSED